MSKPIPFGKYYLLDRINSGGMAEVFRAKAFGVEGFERIVAVKRILPTISADTDFITMFIDEAKIAVQLNHANIAQIFDLGKVGDSYFIALEYVHGLDVRAVFDHAVRSGQKLPIALVCYVAMRICEGLDYAHNRRDASGRPLELVHRDVSPQNMLISFDGDVKLIDFGIAKAATKEGRTRTGILKGKFGYLSPEQVLGMSVDARSDVFGVGIVLHELLTGRRLFVGDSEFSTIEKVRGLAITPPHLVRDDVPEELSRIVMKALSRDLTQRFQSAQALQEELHSFLRAHAEPFTRRELSAFMHENFSEQAANDQEAVGDLQDVDVPHADETDVTPIVETTESRAVIDDTREIPAEGSSKHSSTLLGMPVMARPAAGRSVPPPPPRGGDTGGPASATRPGIGSTRSVPPPPPVAAPTAPPAPPQHARSVPPPPPPGRGTNPPPLKPATVPPGSVRTPTYPPADEDVPSFSPGSMSVSEAYAQPSAVHSVPTAIPSVAAPSAPPLARTLPPPPGAQSPSPYQSVPPAAPGAGNPVLNMDWDDEELSTQVYDKPEDQVDGQGEYDAYGNDPYAQTPGYEEYASQYNPGQGGVATFVPPPGEQLPGFASAFSAVSANAALPSAPSHGRAMQTQPVLSTHAPEKSRSQFYAMAVAGLILICFLGYVFLSKTEPGVVQLTTHPADATVLFDSKPIGSASPFLVTGVAPGDKHLLEVRKDGYRSWSQEVQVQPGQTLQFPVSLQPTDDAPRGEATGPVAGASAGTGAPGSFTLESTPAGAKVLLDGQELGGATPLRVGNLLPKTYTLKLRLADYRELTIPVEVKSGQEVSLPRAVLVPERLHVRVTSQPSGADVMVLRGSEQRALGKTPVDVTLENDDTPWTVQVNKSGFTAYDQTLIAEAGKRDVTVNASLSRTGGGGSSEPVAERPPVERAPRVRPEPRPQPVASAEPPSRGGNGTLRINSRPWSQVTIDGRSIGSTPQMNVSLSEGTHKVTLTNPEFDIKKTITVKIKAGQVETQIVTLQ